MSAEGGRRATPNRKMVALAPVAGRWSAHDVEARLRSLIGDDAGTVVARTRRLEPIGVSFGSCDQDTAPVAELVEIWTSPAAPTHAHDPDRLAEAFDWPWVKSVDETVQAEPSPSSTTRGVLHVGLIHRCDGISRAEFRERWAEQSQRSLANAPRYTGYVTNAVLDEGGDWDGVVEQWYPTIDDFERHRDGFATTKRSLAGGMRAFIAWVQSFSSIDIDWPER